MTARDRIARANAVDAARNADAIRAAQVRCIPHAATRLASVLVAGQECAVPDRAGLVRPYTHRQPVPPAQGG